MATDIARRDLLRGRFTPDEPAIRPPHALPEPAFRDRCRRCPDCATACAAGLIKLDRSGFPKMSFGAATCTFCGDCTRACTTGALDASRARPWRVAASIKPSCLAANGIVCRTCGDACPERAIRFRLLVGGRALAQVDNKLCTGCGACAVLCPVRAVGIGERQEEKAA